MENKMRIISPSLLSADFSALKEQIQLVEDLGVNRLHIDVMDGHFVPNITFGAETCKAIRPFINTIMDVHLMIAPVDSHLQNFVEAGADIISAHVEATPHIHRTVQAIRGFGVRAGVALNPGTPVESLENLLDLVDLVCVMTVNPGFGGQKFIHSQIEKIKKIKELIGDRPIHIEIDGGITAETAPLAVNAGANILVAGSSVFRGGSVEKPEIYGNNIGLIRKSVSKKI
jgi:ribulose-phosphate 3-epimerase